MLQPHETALKFSERRIAMGIFDWFESERSNVEVVSDRIWLTKAAKFAGISGEVSDSLAGSDAPDAIFLVAHFQDCLNELGPLAERAGFDANQVMATKTDALAGRHAPVGLHESQTILIVPAERHPLRSHDDAIADFARSLPCRCRLVFHISLEDPVMQLFAGEWVQNLLKQLGMSDEMPEGTVMHHPAFSVGE
jgi:hypothetical protein